MGSLGKEFRGMRHIALKVRDIQRSKAFYQEFFGLEIVWEPDSKNVYLSSGCDNLALHESPRGFDISPAGQPLDHFGFIVESVDKVRELEKEFRSRGVKIFHPFKVHRDDSASFYCTDPDGILIQVLYEPHLSPQTIE